MVYSILVFLDASPLTVFIGAPDDGAEWGRFFQEVFASFMAYLVTDDERLRHLTNIVARKIMTEGSVAIWRSSENLATQSFKLNFWTST